MIAIKNIYYMLSYAFKVLNGQGYKNVCTEEFQNVAELCTAILIKGVSMQLKRGLSREYIPETEALVSLRGKIDVCWSIKTGIISKKQMICSYDDFTVNSYMNRIIKTTMALLLHADISKSRKKELRKLLVFFGEIDLLDIHNINWNMRYNRNNQNYLMLISICNLVVKGLLQTTSDGKMRLMDFLDEKNMCRLYEKFILEYYRSEFPQLTVSASQIPWQLDNDMRAMLPVMKTDIMISKDEKILIIDAKYYDRTMNAHYDVLKLHSSHLYQIFTYVKNKDAEFVHEPHEVSGMLLYARTDEEALPNNTYLMSGNKISVITLDLNCDFAEITAQLNLIAEEHFG